MSKLTRNLLAAGAAIAGTYVVANYIAKKGGENEEIDRNNLYLKMEKSHAEPENCDCICSKYQSVVKPALDKLFSFGALIAMLPLAGVIALTIVIDDPGPVFFTQKRVGCGGHYFYLHKFRTMKMSAPHDVPTHELRVPNQYITKAGAILRKTSLDELPQIWDIFRGKMSIVGPRPALWNQEDLVNERQKVGANAVLPGLTGLAQIRGRDKLEILDKAKLDGQYAAILERGGWPAFANDVKIFLCTIARVFKRDGVVEGGTSNFSNSNGHWQCCVTHVLEPVKAEDVGFEDYGCYKHFNISTDHHVKVLITGAGSYIGESFKEYCLMYYPNIECDTVDMIDGSWRQKRFEGYDTVFHVAGIAHADVGKMTLNDQELYYKVNTDLAVETARKAKEDGCSQFIFMSSMIIYGAQEYVGKHTLPNPTGIYGNSKWLGDKGVRKLGSDQFKVAVLRAPMIYGKGSHGNYSMLSKLAKKTPLFPDIDNKRSVLYIENLCEFVAKLTLSQQNGVYFPQNSDYTSIERLVREIAVSANHKVLISRVLNSAVFVAKYIPGKMQGLACKAFSSRCYDHALSAYEGLDYQIYDLRSSIIRTESFLFNI